MEKYHVIVHEADKTDGKKRQFVEIYYNCFGVIPNPAWRVFKNNGRYETIRTAHFIHSLPYGT